MNNFLVVGLSFMTLMSRQAAADFSNCKMVGAVPLVGEFYSFNDDGSLAYDKNSHGLISDSKNGNVEVLKYKTPAFSRNGKQSAVTNTITVTRDDSGKVASLQISNNFNPFSAGSGINPPTGVTVVPTSSTNYAFTYAPDGQCQLSQIQGKAQEARGKKGQNYVLFDQAMCAEMNKVLPKISAECNGAMQQLSQVYGKYAAKFQKQDLKIAPAGMGAVVKVSSDPFSAALSIADSCIGWTSMGPGTGAPQGTSGWEKFNQAVNGSEPSGLGAMGDIPLPAPTATEAK